MAAKIVFITMLYFLGSDAMSDSTAGDCAESQESCASSRDDNVLLQKKVQVSLSEVLSYRDFDKVVSYEEVTSQMPTLKSWLDRCAIECGFSDFKSAMEHPRWASPQITTANGLVLDPSSAESRLTLESEYPAMIKLRLPVATTETADSLTKEEEAEAGTLEEEDDRNETLNLLLERRQWNEVVHHAVLDRTLVQKGVSIPNPVKAIEVAAKAAESVLKDIGKATIKMADDARDAIVAAYNYLGSAIQALGGFLHDFGDAVVGMLTGVFSCMGDLYANLGDCVTTWARQSADCITGNGCEVWVGYPQCSRLAKEEMFEKGYAREIPLIQQREGTAYEAHDAAFGAGFSEPGYGPEKRRFMNDTITDRNSNVQTDSIERNLSSMQMQEADNVIIASWEADHTDANESDVTRQLKTSGTVSLHAGFLLKVDLDSSSVSADIEADIHLDANIEVDVNGDKEKEIPETLIGRERQLFRKVIMVGKIPVEVVLEAKLRYYGNVVATGNFNGGVKVSQKINLLNHLEFSIAVPPREPLYSWTGQVWNPTVSPYVSASGSLTATLNIGPVFTLKVNKVPISWDYGPQIVATASVEASASAELGSRQWSSECSASFEVTTNLAGDMSWGLPSIDPAAQAYEACMALVELARLNPVTAGGTCFLKAVLDFDPIDAMEEACYAMRDSLPQVVPPVELWKLDLDLTELLSEDYGSDSCVQDAIEVFKEAKKLLLPNPSGGAATKAGKDGKAARLVWTQQKHKQCGSTNAENNAANAAGVPMHSPGRNDNSHLRDWNAGTMTLAACKKKCLVTPFCRGIELTHHSEDDTHQGGCALMYSGLGVGGAAYSCWYFEVDGSIPDITAGSGDNILSQGVAHYDGKSGVYSECDHGGVAIGVRDWDNTQASSTSIFSYECDGNGCRVECRGPCSISASCVKNTRVFDGTRISGGGNKWSGYSTCPQGYTAVGIRKLDFSYDPCPPCNGKREDRLRARSLGRFLCDSNGCKVWCFGGNCVFVASCVAVPVNDGTVVIGAANSWSPYSTCPIGTAVGVRKLDKLTSSSGQNHFERFRCGSNGCQVFCRHGPCEIRASCMAAEACMATLYTGSAVGVGTPYTLIGAGDFPTTSYPNDRINSIKIFGPCRVSVWEACPPEVSPYCASVNYPHNVLSAGDHGGMGIASNSLSFVRIEQACPSNGISMHERCWYLSAKGSTCSFTCKSKGLTFSYHAAPVASPMVPLLLGGREPSRKQFPWEAMECYVPEDDRYHTAKPPAHINPDWSYSSCQLACPCSHAQASTTAKSQATTIYRIVSDHQQKWNVGEIQLSKAGVTVPIIASACSASSTYSSNSCSSAFDGSTVSGNHWSPDWNVENPPYWIQFKASCDADMLKLYQEGLAHGAASVKRSLDGGLTWFDSKEWSLTKSSSWSTLSLEPKCEEASLVFVTGAAGTNSCPIGAEKITDKATCQKYASSVGFSFDDRCSAKPGSNPGWCNSRVTGCWTDTFGGGRAFFNRQTNNVAKRDTTPVCLQGSCVATEADLHRGSACGGSQWTDLDYPIDQCVSACQSKDWCVCITWFEGRTNRCRLERGVRSWRGVQLPYSALNMQDIDDKCKGTTLSSTTCELGCNACKNGGTPYNWYAQNWNGGNPSSWWNNKDCGCCMGSSGESSKTSSKFEQCQRVCKEA